MTEDRQVALRRFHRRQKAAHNIQSTGLEPGEQHTFGGLHKVLNLLKPENRRVDGVMDMHTCYLLGEPVVQSSLEVPSFRGKHASLTVREQAEAAEAAGPRVCVALSTEALLLNGYRMTRQAMPMQVQVDTTWKLVKEGHGTIVVGTTAVDQAFHAIAYAVVTARTPSATSWYLLRSGMLSKPWCPSTETSGSNFYFLNYKCTVFYFLTRSSWQACVHSGGGGATLSHCTDASTVWLLRPLSVCTVL